MKRVEYDVVVILFDVDSAAASAQTVSLTRRDLHRYTFVVSPSPSNFHPQLVSSQQVSP